MSLLSFKKVKFMSLLLLKDLSSNFFLYVMLEMSHLNTSGNDSRFNFLQNGNNVSLPKPISILMLALSLRTKVT